MKSSCQKGLRITGTAIAVSAMLLFGTALSGCRDSKNRTSADDVKLTVAEEGDLVTGKPYKIRADRNLQELRAEHGNLTAVNPVTGEMPEKTNGSMRSRRNILLPMSLTMTGITTIAITAAMPVKLTA